MDFIKHALSQKLLIYFAGYIGVDLFLRKTTAASWGLREYCVYVLSAGWLFFLYSEIIARIKDKDSNRVRNFPAIVFAILVTATISISYGFFVYFRILPNISSFGILYFSPRDFLGSIVSRISVLNTLMFAAFFLIFYLFIYTIAQGSSKRQRSPKEKGAIILLFMVSIPLFQSRTTITSGALLPEMNALFNLGIATYDELFDQENSGRKLPHPHRPTLTSLHRKAPCNMLLILNESLRADHLSAFGYPKKTSPFLDTLIKETKGITFPHFYAVSTRTIIALPSWITGISPVQTAQRLLRAPIYSNYAKQLQNQKTFLISSQPYEPGNVLQFINDGSWDSFMYAEKSGHPFQPATQSISDAFLPPYLDTFLDGLTPHETFLGVIHTFGTHHPYYCDPKAQKHFGDSTPEQRYDAALLTLDTTLQTIVHTLKQHGRFENTIIISTSDHAEAMNEHGYWGHLRTFYNEEAHVPAWIIIPQTLRSKPPFAGMYKQLRANADQYLCNIDIMPTVLDILGLWDDPHTAPYQEPMLGSPITRPIAGLRVIRMQNYQHVEKAMFPGTALIYGQYKYILLLENGQQHHALFDLTRDPQEKHNIWEQAPKSLQTAIASELKKYQASNNVLTYRPPSPWDTPLEMNQ